MATTATADAAADSGGGDSARRARPAPDRRGSVSQRLNHLFETITPNGRPLSAAQVARWINENDGQISAVYILKIRSGERPDPSPRYLRHLADFFAVPASFFWDDDPPELDRAAIEARIRTRSGLIRSMTERISMLSQRSQLALSDVVDSLLEAEGRTPPTA